MKTKGIIIGIIIAIIVIIGAIGYFIMSPSNNTQQQKVSTLGTNNSSTNTSNNKNDESDNGTINKANTKSTNIASTKDTNSNTSTNKNNGTSNAVSNTNASENKKVNNTNTDTTSKNNITDTNTTSIMVKSTGDFADIVNGANYMIGSINGTNIIIPVKNGQVVNNQLVLPEYYTSEPNETFTAKISSLGNGNFILYEFYNGQNTATFKLKYNNNQEGMQTLSGTYTHAGSSSVSGITFYLNGAQFEGMASMPFYHGIVDGTPVRFIMDGTQSMKYIEYYEGDNNSFILTQDWNILRNTDYDIGFTESYNGNTTGEYLLKYDGQNYTQLTGVYIKKPGTPQQQSFPVTFTGNLSPN
ncbi:MAG: hypothetical protein ACRC57_01520 [Sarcina sp.]